MAALKKNRLLPQNLDFVYAITVLQITYLMGFIGSSNSEFNIAYVCKSATRSVE